MKGLGGGGGGGGGGGPEWRHPTKSEEPRAWLEEETEAGDDLTEGDHESDLLYLQRSLGGTDGSAEVSSSQQP